MEYIVLQDRLRQELLDYYSFLNAKMEEMALEEAEDDEDIDELDDDIDFEDEQQDIDNYLLNSWNQYINGIVDDDFFVVYNTDKNTSNQLKLMVMVQLYEFVSFDYTNANDIERVIYDQLNKDLSPANAIRLYNQYSMDVLETYTYFMRDNISINKYRIGILDNNLIDNIVSINPSSILDYRLLMGIKFGEEDISSVKMGKTIISLVDMAKMMYKNNRFKDIYEAIKYIIDDSIYINIYINTNWEYFLANIYEHLLIKGSYTDKEKQFIGYLEQDVQLLYRKFYDMKNYREQLIYEFYLLNQDKFGEEELYKLRCNTEKQGKEKVLVISPYYIEEQSYFKNRY